MWTVFWNFENKHNDKKNVRLFLVVGNKHIKTFLANIIITKLLVLIKLVDRHIQKKVDKVIKERKTNN